MYVLTGPEKLLPGLVKGALEEQRAPYEVGPSTPGVTISNRAFDLTPLELLTGILVDGRMLSPHEAGTRARRVRIHSAIRAELERPTSANSRIKKQPPR